MSTDRKSITFKHAEGVIPLPSQQELGQLPLRSKAKFWNIIHNHLRIQESPTSYQIGTKLYCGILDYFVDSFGVFADDFPNDIREIIPIIKKLFGKDVLYYETIQFVEYYIRHCASGDTKADLISVFERDRLAYRYVDGSVVRFASEDEHQQFVEAVDLLERADFGGAKVHLLSSAKFLSQGLWADSVRESIHAVESLVRKMTGSKSFGAAIAELNKREPLHEAFKKALGALYGYTSDAQGIRHPMIDGDSSQVDEPTALYMHSACSSLAAFIVRKYAE